MCQRAVRAWPAGQLNPVGCPLRSCSPIITGVAIRCLVPIVLVWAVLSAWLGASWFSPPSSDNTQVYLGSTSGAVYFGVVTWQSQPKPHFRFGRTYLQYCWWFRLTWSDRLRQFFLPLWAIILLLLGPTVLSWYRRLRSPIRLCPRCEYPVGASPRCSECGHPMRPQEGAPNQSL